MALHNPDVRAVVGLDGTYGLASAEGAAAFKSQYDPSRVAVSTEILDIDRADAELDLSVLQSFQRADRYFVPMPGMFHGDFTSFVMGAQAFHLPPPENAAPNWTQAVGAEGYQRVCVGILDFLRSRFTADDGTFRNWQAEMSRLGASVTHEAPSAQ